MKVIAHPSRWIDAYLKQKSAELGEVAQELRQLDEGNGAGRDGVGESVEDPHFRIERSDVFFHGGEKACDVWLPARHIVA